MKGTFILITHVFFVVFFITCNKSSSKKNSENNFEHNNGNWVIEELKNQIAATGREDSIEIFGLPIQSLPLDLLDPSRVKYLRIDCIESNCINTLSGISKFHDLETLIISKSSLINIPEEIGKLNKLKELRILSGRKLTSVPIEIGDLKNLEILDLWRNQIKEIPITIYSLPNLSELYIGENNFNVVQINDIKAKMPKCDVKTGR